MRLATRCLLGIIALIMVFSCPYGKQLNTRTAKPAVAKSTNNTNYKGFKKGDCRYYVAKKFDKENFSDDVSMGINWKGSPKDWYKNAQAAGWTTSKDPTDAEEGAIAVWIGNGIGHVAFVVETDSESDDSDGDSTEGITITEQYWPEDDDSDVHEVFLPYSGSYSVKKRHDYSFVGYILPEKDSGQVVDNPGDGKSDNVSGISEELISETFKTIFNTLVKKVTDSDDDGDDISEDDDVDSTDTETSGEDLSTTSVKPTRNIKKQDKPKLTELNYIIYGRMTSLRKNRNLGNFGNSIIYGRMTSLRKNRNSGNSGNNTTDTTKDKQDGSEIINPGNSGNNITDTTKDEQDGSEIKNPGDSEDDGDDVEPEDDESEDGDLDATSSVVRSGHSSARNHGSTKSLRTVGSNNNVFHGLQLNPRNIKEKDKSVGNRQVTVSNKGNGKSPNSVHRSMRLNFSDNQPNGNNRQSSVQTMKKRPEKVPQSRFVIDTTRKLRLFKEH